MYFSTEACLKGIYRKKVDSTSLLNSVSLQTHTKKGHCNSPTSLKKLRIYISIGI